MRIVAAAAVLLVVSGCLHGPAATAGRVVVSFGSHSAGAEIAADKGTRETGLMGRRELGKDAGMLFLFPTTQNCLPSCFYMKDTLIPLSIAFMSRTRRDAYVVVGVLDMQPCTTPRCQLYGPGEPFDAALETNLGWLQAAGVGKGTNARIRGTLPNPT
jgi:uncharacterized membrane protein (UPF0127 family)